MSKHTQSAETVVMHGTNIQYVRIKDTPYTVCSVKDVFWKQAPHRGGCFTYNGIGNENMEKAIAVEIQLKERGNCAARGNDELWVFVGAGDIHTVSQEAECVHHHILRVPGKSQVEVAWQDLFLHVEEILHQFRQQHTLPSTNNHLSQVHQ